MSAQAGNALLLDYGPQGSQQGGNTLVLSSTPPAPARTMLTSSTASRWGSASRSHNTVRAPMATTRAFDPAARAPWIKGSHKSAQSTTPWGVASKRDTASVAPWGKFSSAARAQAVASWLVTVLRDAERSAPWGKYSLHVGVSPVAPWVVSAKQDQAGTVPWGQHLFAQIHSVTGWVGGHPAGADRYLPWMMFSRQMAPGWGVVTPPETDIPTALFYILPARFYMTAHTVFAQRLPDLADIPIFEAMVAADSGSFCWTLQASGPASLFELLAPVDGLPAQLRLTLDGIPWVFAIDAISRNRQFGQAGVSVQGRSVTALIGAPYLRATTRDNSGGALTAQQLAVAALDTTGIDLDWGLTDWLVPAGSWSHQGTPLDAVMAITQAAGGYLQSHRSAATLLSRHPYGQRTGDLPGAPWGWMTGAADVELATDALITEAVERKDGPDIDSLYVSGTSAGVLALVKREGSAAEKLASMVTDPLITHTDAARQRGLSVLGSAGNKYSVRLDLPVLTGTSEPGVLDVGQLVQVNASIPWRGRVRAVSVSAKRPSLRQTITLERHLS